MDLNGDGTTDAEDAQIILDYVSGSVSNIDKIADVSGNGKVSSYDAHLLLATIGEGYVMVPAGESIDVTVSMTMGAETKAHLDAMQYPWTPLPSSPRTWVPQTHSFGKSPRTSQLPRRCM